MNDKPLLINFVGSPCSGKTTVAAMVFADLKESGVVAEFISERARDYIVSKKRFGGVDVVKLNKNDQQLILQDQAMVEMDYYAECSAGTVIVSDSSPLNTFLYEPSLVGELKGVVGDWSTCNPLIFYCPLIETAFPDQDVNRIHTQKEAIALDAKCVELLNNLHFPFVKIDGSSQSRKLKVLRAIYNHLDR